MCLLVSLSLALDFGRSLLKAGSGSVPDTGGGGGRVKQRIQDGTRPFQEQLGSVTHAWQLLLQCLLKEL